MPLTKTCVIERVGSLDDVYRALDAQLGLPPHFGRNLDALFDSLANDVEGPFVIEWRGTATARAALGGPLFEQLLDLMREVADERDDVTLRLEP